LELSPLVTFQPEILYVRKGARWEYAGGWEYSYTSKEAWTLDYFEFPMLLKITPSGQNSVQFAFCLGPAPAVLLAARDHYTYNSADYNYTSTEQLRGIRKVDLGIVLGGGFGFPVGRGLITTDVRYTVGVSDIFEDNEGSPVHNRSLSFLMGYLF
jgi:hypothetical protein